MNMTPTILLVSTRSGEGESRNEFVPVRSLVGALSLRKASAQQEPFPIEASISDLRQALDSGRLSSSALVDFYLKRIQAYDRAGPELNSLITVNQNAATEAKRLDERKQGLSVEGTPVRNPGDSQRQHEHRRYSNDRRRPRLEGFDPA